MRSPEDIRTHRPPCFSDLVIPRVFDYPLHEPRKRVAALDRAIGFKFHCKGLDNDRIGLLGVEWFIETPRIQPRHLVHRLDDLVRRFF